VNHQHPAKVSFKYLFLLLDIFKILECHERDETIQKSIGKANERGAKMGALK
jgi:hypothetical protein